MLQRVDREMKNLQPSALYNAPDFELLALFINAFQPPTLVEALDQGWIPTAMPSTPAAAARATP